MKASAKPHEG